MTRDGEVIPRDEMTAEVGLIAHQTDLPVSADLEDGYGDPGATVARPIDVGVVGANLEDQMKPLARCRRCRRGRRWAAQPAGVAVALNARTDALRRSNADPPTSTEARRPAPPGHHRRNALPAVHP